MPVGLLPALVKNMDYQYIHNWNSKLQVNGICFDSRKIKPGYIFVAIKGKQLDGHDYIKEALRKGAAVVVAETPPLNECSATWIRVFDSQLALAQLTANFHGHPCKELILVGITGSCGKTTTSTLLQNIYEAADKNTGLIGTVNNSCRGDSWPASMTTPDALETQNLLRMMVDSGVTHASMEVSSHSLAQKRVDGIQFDGTIFTNISPNHLDFHQNLENYVQSKKRLAFLAKERGFILANADDPFFKNLKPGNNVALYFYGKHPSCDFYISNDNVRKDGSFFRLTVQNPEVLEYCCSDKHYHFYVPILGRHNIYNAAAAASASLLTKIPENYLYSGLASFRGVERRLQIYQLDGFNIVDDKAMTPGGINAVFQTLQELSFSRMIVVYALRGSRGTQVNEDNGRTLAQWIKQLKINYFFSTSSVSHVSQDNEVLPEEEKAFFRGARSAGRSPLHFKELPEAISQALKVAAPGSALLILGSKGMDEGVRVLQEQLEKAPVNVSLAGAS